MKFLQPLAKGHLIRRYKRFLADVALTNGKVVTAHCANPGSMQGLATKGMEVWLSPAQNPKRKLGWTWELVRVGRGLVGVNTSLPNKIVYEAIAAKGISELNGYSEIYREVAYGKASRIDLLLDHPKKGKCFVEVKNVTLKRKCGAEFPDSVTTRGTKHLGELTNMIEEGHRAVMLYLVQRNDCGDFRIASDIDPLYNDAFQTAITKGVEAICYSCKLRTNSITIDRPLPVVSGPF